MQSKVLITIDTEVRARNRDLPNAFETDVLGQINGAEYGADWAAQQLKRYHLPGVFFLDVYGSARYPVNQYVDLCQRLLGQGHSVQLHTHPDVAYDSKRRHMHEYSLPEQTTIIQEGSGLLRSWTGQVPIAHRAGRYGADEQTLRALRTNGIYLDSSFFYGRADCKLPFPNSNRPLQRHGVWEIPVTVAPEPIEKMGYRFPFWSRHLWKNYQKLDVNCMPDWQLCRSVTEALGRVPYVITFLHSFSFIRREPSGFVPDEGAMAAFQALLGLLSDKQVPVITFEHVAAELVEPQAQQVEAVSDE